MNASMEGASCLSLNFNFSFSLPLGQYSFVWYSIHKANIRMNCPHYDNVFFINEDCGVLYDTCHKNYGTILLLYNNIFPLHLKQINIMELFTNEVQSAIKCIHFLPQP